MLFHCFQFQERYYKENIFNITSFCNLKNIDSLGFQTFKEEMAYAVANANVFAYLWYGCQGFSTDTKCDLIFEVYVLALVQKIDSIWEAGWNFFL